MAKNRKTVPRRFLDKPSIAKAPFQVNSRALELERGFPGISIEEA